MGTFAKMKENLNAIDPKTASYMLLNFGSSTGIVIVNKIVMDKFGFQYGSTLTCFHFIVTFLCLVVSALFGVFEPKRLPLVQVAKLAAASMGFVVLTNMSLLHNSVGFYQIAKVMTTPTIVVLEALIYGKYLERKLAWTLAPVCVGVMITAATDFKLNQVGGLYALAAIVVTSFYQIWSGTLQKGLDCNALQLQFATAPLSALFLAPLVPLFDDYRRDSLTSIFNFQFNYTVMFYISLTGLIAFLVNISIFLVIGKSSPLTYNILGHAKTSFIIISDFILFDRPFEVRNASGVALALTGVFWYTHLKLEKSRLEKESKAPEKLANATESLSKANSLKTQLSKSYSVKSDSASPRVMSREMSAREPGPREVANQETKTETV